MQLMNPGRAELIIEKLEKLMEIFEADKIQSNTALAFYYQAAVFYCSQQRKTEALDQLKRFAGCSIHMIDQGIRLHGNDFFTRVDEWVQRTGFGAGPVEMKAYNF